MTSTTTSTSNSKASGDADPKKGAERSDDEQRSRGPVDDLLDVFVFAPLGFAAESTRLFPEMAERGRQEFSNAKVIGKFAVDKGQSMGEGSLAKTAEAVIGIVFPGMAKNDRADAPESEASNPSGATRTKTTARAKSSSSSSSGSKSASSSAAPSTKAEAAPSAKTTNAKAAETASRTKTKPKKSTKAKKTTKKAATKKAVATDLPIEDYDGLSASQIVGMLDGLRRSELAAVRDYEVANRNRRTIIGRVAQLSS